MSSKLAKRLRKWALRLAIATVALAALGGVLWYIEARTGYSRSISAFIIWGTRYEAWKIREPSKPWKGGQHLNAGTIPGPNVIYQKSNVWRVDLSFSAEGWKGLTPRRFDPMPNFLLPNGLVLVRNPAAPRSGLLGAMGYAFDWTHADLEFGGTRFTNVAVRKKGNVASFVEKCPFKIDLNRFAKGQTLAGLDELTFNNLWWDQSCVAEALAYEFFRDCGVPAPRTAYAWLTVSVAGQSDRKPFGLYLMIEPIDEDFAADRFGRKDVPIFKPVTYSLFEDLGDDWSAYEKIYDLKTKATAEQRRRIVDFARLVTSGTDEEFASRASGFLDMDAFARFLAGNILLSQYDSILALGQNFYMYLDPRSNKLGFTPWDLDSAWGNFWLGTREELANASIWHPWVGQNRLLERIMGLEEFQEKYRSHLEDLLDRLLVPTRLHKKMDELAAVLREPIASESSFRLQKFEQTVGLKPVEQMPGETRHGLRARAYPFMRFVEARAKSVREQLDGKSTGIIVKLPAER